MHAPRVLLLLRHAEAQPATNELTDFDRSLTAHGRAQARRVGQRLAAAGLRPDELLASPALRARDTGAIVAAQLGGIARIVHDPELYLASASLLLSAVQRREDSVRTLLLVGHNPGLSVLVRELAASVAQAIRRADNDPLRHASPAPAGTDAFELDLAGPCRLVVEAASWRELGARAVRTATLI
jgi:phosphohistidine phosphatase